MARKNASDDDAGTDPGFKQEHRTEWSRFKNSTHELNLKSTDDGASCEIPQQPDLARASSG